MGSSDGFAFSLDLVQHSYYRFLSKGIRITSGTFLGNGRYILGTYQGAIEYDKQEARPLRKACLGFYLDELRVLDKEVTVETENSPLKKALNCTATLQLEHNENTFSFTATAIRYTEKQDIAYSWKLDHTDWSTPSVDNRIRFSNLPPGEYIFLCGRYPLITVGRLRKEICTSSFVNPFGRQVELSFVTVFWHLYWALWPYVHGSYGKTETFQENKYGCL